MTRVIGVLGIHNQSSEGVKQLMTFSTVGSDSVYICLNKPLQRSALASQIFSQTVISEMSTCPGCVPLDGVVFG